MDGIRAALSGDDVHHDGSPLELPTVPLEHLDDYVENALEPILRSFAEVARQSRTAAKIATLKQLARHHLDMIAAAENIPLRRPSVGRLQYLKRQAADLGAVINLYLEVLAAPNMHEAQNYARQAQSHIDAMASRREVQNKIQSAVQEISSADFLDGGGIDLFRALSVRHGGLSVAELEHRGRTEFSELSGREPQVGTGLSYLTCDLFSEANFDRDRFKQVVKRTAQLSKVNAETLDSLAEDAALLSDLHEARLRAVQAWVRFQRTVSGRITTPALVREVLALYSELFEQVGIPVMGSVLLLSGQKTMPYAKMRIQNATAIADNLSKSPALNGLVEGLDINLRNATAHGHSYTVTEDSLCIRLKSYQGAMAFDVLTDKMMALMESFTAIQLVLDDELSSRGQDGHQVRDLELFGFSVSEVVRLLLTALDVTVHSTVDDDELWTIAIGKTERSKFTLAKVISNVLPSTAKTLVLQYERDAKVHRLTVEAPVLAGVSAHQLNDPVKFLQAAGSVRVDGAPVLDPPARRRFISHHLSKILLSGDIGIVGQLRDLRDATRAWSDPEVGDAINDTIRWLRGVPPRAGVQNYRHLLTRKLDDWARRGDFNLP
ncbi:hypothetical protein [Pseudarthrobacter defluvii]|uniref:hypothetical protein n=1 Tax=Pseudarthrobacter defluvii TaxID=410837 RepID=UPI0027D81CC9|nr:hypothetical protein [Pseudarthrobacter defluvii]